ncbi:MAG: CDP-diacylglycerol--glycerol-3-phosphate 3-phosphatidyltransferase [Peptococcaceae bacterium]|nr:CDP-diacylglycerol--glycerol-3-phosphate 3-phosphatidyltransferase [Peptococcaceae bacterium]
MNIPNQLTTLRVILIPVFMFFFTSDITANNIIAAVIFIVASLTDFLDGHLARKWNLVTNFGKIMDPFADKLLVLTALIYLAISGIIPGWPVIIIIGRELLVTSLRALAADNGIILAARNLGKFKTVSQMFAIIFLILGWQIIGLILLYIAVALTIISLIDYLIQLSKSIKFN